jgi:uncharacterized protein (TIGR02594 family)
MKIFNTACYLASGAGLVFMATLIEAPNPDSQDAELYSEESPYIPTSGGPTQTKPHWDPGKVPAGTGPTPWMDTAAGYIGLTEEGKNRGELIDQWNQQYGGALGDAWCATYVNHILATNGIAGTNSASSQSFKTWGTDAGGPVTGSVVVFKWPGEKTGGHVGFVHSVNSDGSINVLGGNQSDGVNITRFQTTHVVGYRLPPGQSGGGINTGGGNYQDGGGYNETR